MKKKHFISYFIIFLILIFCVSCEKRSENKPPLIGITCSYSREEGNRFGDFSIRESYARSIEQAGGIPVMLPAVSDEKIIAYYAENLDGIVLSGGDDVPPESYGEIPHEKTVVISERRYDFESRLIKAWLETKKPILGICLGLQFVNVIRGGTLIQDIPSEKPDAVPHKADGGCRHTIRIKSGTRLFNILGGPDDEVNSNHHQAVEKAGEGLSIAAESPDGIIEAMEMSDRFGLFLQWHPEAMADERHSVGIYRALVEACRAH